MAAAPRSSSFSSLDKTQRRVTLPAPLWEQLEAHALMTKGSVPQILEAALAKFFDDKHDATAEKLDLLLHDISVIRQMLTAGLDEPIEPLDEPSEEDFPRFALRQPEAFEPDTDTSQGVWHPPPKPPRSGIGWILPAMGLAVVCALLVFFLL